MALAEVGANAKPRESTTLNSGIAPDAPAQGIGILTGMSPLGRHDDPGVPTMRKNLLLSAVACLVLATAAVVPQASAGNGNQPPPAKAKGLDPDTRVKLPPKEIGPERLDLDNNEVSTSEAGPSARAVLRSGCILPRTFVKYKVFTGSPRVYTFKAIPSRGFDVVMRIDTSGVHKTVDRYYAGGNETYRIRTFVPNLPVNVVIRGFGNSSGCYALSVTP